MIRPWLIIALIVMNFSCATAQPSAAERLYSFEESKFITKSSIEKNSPAISRGMLLFWQRWTF